ncbi:MAG: hypothetical protein NTX05_00850 [Fusobacteria bacterium]|nr:hypothetical protein [Fusobacteriota bacterium]
MLILKRIFFEPILYKLIIGLFIIMTIDTVLFHNNIYSRYYYADVVILYSFISSSVIRSLYVAKERVIYSLSAVFVGLICLTLFNNNILLSYYVGAFFLYFLASKLGNPTFIRGLGLYGVVIVIHNNIHSLGQSYAMYTFDRTYQTLIGAAVVVCVEFGYIILLRYFQHKKRLKLGTLYKISNPSSILKPKLSFLSSFIKPFKDKNFIFMCFTILIISLILHYVLGLSYNVYGLALIFAPGICKLNSKDYFINVKKFGKSIALSVIALVVIYVLPLNHSNFNLTILIAVIVVHFVPFIIPFFKDEDKRLAYRIIIIYFLQGYLLNQDYSIALSWVIAFMSVFVVTGIILFTYLSLTTKSKIIS